MGTVAPGRRYNQRLPEERHADRRARLLDAGAAAFADRGYSSVTIEQLCAAARVSTRGFYADVGSKEALLGVLHDELNAAALIAAVDALGEVAADDVAARARAGLGAYFSVMTADADRARVVLVESVGVSPAMEARRQAAVDAFVELLAAELDHLAAAGLLPPADHGLTAVAVVGAVKELVTAHAVGALAPRPLGAVVDAAVRVLLAAAGVT